MSDDQVEAMIRLQQLSEQYRHVGQRPDATRAHIVAMLEAIVTIHSPAMSPAWAEDLASQLTELDFGTAGLIVAPTPRDRRGAPERSVQKAVLCAFACAYLSMLVKAGLRLPEADGKVKRRMKVCFSQLGVRLSSSTLKNWRWHMSSEEGRSTPDAEVYRCLLQWAERQNMRKVKDIDAWADGWLAPF